MIYCLFHSPCTDGFSAAFCAWLYLRETSKYVPVSYLTKVPEIEPGSDVYLLDFCYPREILLDLKSKMKSVVVLDHHETNFKKSGDLDFCTFDMNRSGAMMAWGYFSDLAEKEIENSFFGGINEVTWDNFRKIKPIIEYVQDRDLYQNKLPNSREVFFALSSLPLKFEVWAGLNLETLIQEGKVITRSVDMLVSNNLKHSFITDKFIEYGFPKVPVVNSSITVYNTDVCQALLDKYPDAPFAGTFFRLVTGKYKWSLRSRSGVNVASLAEKFGGGGHPGASSFAHDSGA